MSAGTLVSTPLRRRPIPRLNIALAALALITVLGSVVGTGELLRHPGSPTVVPEAELAGGDPRVELLCPEPQPREGQARDSVGNTLEPVRVTSNDLFDCPQTFDGRQVLYRGEVVGALMARGSGVWTQLNDDVYAEGVGPLPAHRDYRGGNAGVGVLLPTQVAGDVSYVGGPQTRGDVLEVRGVFHRVDPSGEVAVIRADAGDVAVRGRPFPDPPLVDRQIVALFAMVVAVGVVTAERMVAWRR